MKIITYNAGLLDHFFSNVPESALRARLLGPYLRSAFEKDQIEVALLQEVWSLEDVERLRESLEDQYLILCPSKNILLATGLVTIVRKSANWHLQDFHFFEYHHTYLGSWRAVHEIITGFRRGALFTRLRSSSGMSVVIANTHLTPFEKNWKLRRRQLQSLGARLHDILKPEDVWIIGGDINHSCEYLKPSQKKKSLQVLTDFKATWKLKDPAENLLTYDPQRNSLAAQCKWGNAGKPLNLDRIWMGPADKLSSGSARLYAEEVFTGSHPLSDHYAVMVEIPELKVALQAPVVPEPELAIPTSL